MKRKVIVYLYIICILSAVGCSDSEKTLTDISFPKTAWEAAAEKTDIPLSAAKNGKVSATVTTAAAKKTSLLSSPNDIDLHDTDGSDTNYMFTYDGENFEAVYTPDNWHITDSYKITDADDMIFICQALKDIHPISNKNRDGYRTAEDMAYEWKEHNIAYSMLPDSSEWKENVRSVDLDPDDQGKSLMDMAEDRLNNQKN